MSSGGRDVRVAVVTPYCREPADMLRHCHASVTFQTHPCTHFLVADGFPSAEVAGWPVEHIILSKPHHDVGNTPRGLGALSAMNQGFDAVAFLDADNWYYPHHIEAMVALHRATGAAVCTASRTMHRLDGSLMYADTFECNGKTHVDTSCYFITRAAFRLLPVWVMMPTQLGPVGDTVLWQAIQARGISHAHHPQPTVAFRTQYQVHYRNLGETPPPGTKTNDDSTGKALAWWTSLPVPIRNEWARYFASKTE